jgi:hypothetical protein
MRKISDRFLDQLQTGFLSPLTDSVRTDIDLDLFIRDGYINIYYKGSSLLKLSEKPGDVYAVDIHPKFLNGMVIGDLTDRRSTDAFMANIPRLKENIIQHGKPSLEIEYEQLIIRANNCENRNNSEYFIFDRQYTLGTRDRIDLMGIYWPAPGRRREQDVAPCLIEIKFALNNDIRNVHEQLQRYYELVAENAEYVAKDLKSSLVQRLDLGLYNQPPGRVDALRTLNISGDIEDFKFILVLVDYNPHSTLLELSTIKALPFSDQIMIMHAGFGMWEDQLEQA